MNKQKFFQGDKVRQKFSAYGSFSDDMPLTGEVIEAIPGLRLIKVRFHTQPATVLYSWSTHLLEKIND